MGLRKILDFPFSTGKQWKYAYSGKEFVVKGYLLDFSENFKILGWEDTEGKAGKFKVLKLEYETIGNSLRQWGPKDREFKHYYWYSPDAKYFVKCQYDKEWMKGNKEIFNWELTSFQPKK